MFNIVVVAIAIVIAHAIGIALALAHRAVSACGGVVPPKSVWFVLVKQVDFAFPTYSACIRMYSEYPE